STALDRAPCSTSFPYTTLFRSDIAEAEMPALFGHARVEHDLEQQIAELVTQVGEVTALDGVGDFVGLFDGVRRDAVEILRDVPRSEEHTSELQSRENLVCRLLL